MSDLRYTLRSLARTPGFTTVVVLSLALGICATATVLCWMRHILLEPLPGVARQKQIVALVSNQGGGNISLLDSRDLDQLDRVFAGVAVSEITPASLVVDRHPAWIYGQIASANFFSLLGVKPLLGRTFLPDEDRKLGGNPVLVLGEALWRRRFAADPAIVGRVVELNRHAFTVIGVVPAAFRGTMTGLDCEFWAPLSMVREVASWPADYITYRGSRAFHNVARLRPGVTLPQAQSAVDALDAHLTTAFAGTNREVHHRVVRYADCPYGAQSVLGPTLRLLLAVSIGVLLIVAANVANLLLARAATRQKEIAIRLAAGASRWRLFRLLLAESLVLALLGGALGTLFAVWAVDAIMLFIPAMSMPVALAYTLDGRTLLLTLLVTLATAVVFGLAPAWRASHLRPYETLRKAGRASGGGAAHHRFRNLLVMSEIALAFVLLIGAALCLKGLRQARQVDFGFNPDHVLTAGLRIGMNGYNKTTGTQFYRQLQQRLGELPQVEAAALASWFPLGLEGGKSYPVMVDGYVRPPGEDPSFTYARISPRYFDTLQIPLIAGRDFTLRDDADAPAVAIVNTAFARHFWPGQDAIGRTFGCNGRSHTIVGIAKTGKYRALDEAPRPFFYLPYLQGVPELDLNVCLRTRGDPAAIIEPARKILQTLDPGVEFWGAMPLKDHVQGTFFAQSTASGLLLFLGVLALALALMGVYAVMAYNVGQRTQEFGVRMALGARPHDVLRQVIRRGFVLSALGSAAGLLLALGVTRLLAGFLYGVSPFDPATFLVIPLLLMTCALAACWLPARRATKVDPMTALRAE